MEHLLSASSTSKQEDKEQQKNKITALAEEAGVTVDQMQRQLNLELEMYRVGRAKVERRQTENIANGHADWTAGGSQAVRKCLIPIVDVIVRFLNKEAGLLDPLLESAIDARAAKKSKRIAGANYRKYLEDIDDTVAIAEICMRVIIEGMAREDKLTDLRNKLVDRLEAAAKLAALRKSDKDLEYDVRKTAKRKGKGSVGTAKAVEHAMKNTCHWEPWELEAKHRLAYTLLRVIEKHTGLLVLWKNPTGKNRTEVLARPSQELLKLIEDTNERQALMAASMKPFLVSPKPWTTPFNGAFWGANISRRWLVKTHRKEHLDQLRRSTEAGRMTAVYEAVNTAQATGYGINDKVFETLKWAWEGGETLGGLLPLHDPIPLPQKPAEGASEAEWQEWKPKAHEVHNANRLSMSKRLRIATALTTAEAYEDKEAFYFSYQLDYRGRIYPMQTGLQPQGNDLEKGLLEFAEGVAISDKSAERSLAIHGANMWGEDKVSYDDRVQWVIDNEEIILQIARNPKMDANWPEADKPWQFLAFCFEWAAYREHGFGYMSHLPCAVDGSCNGLQHLSALGRDEDAAESVNLLPNDTPADLYQEIADEVVTALTKMVRDGDEKAPIASDLLEWRIDRKVTKGAVMIIPYGGTQRGCLKKIEEALREKGLGSDESNARLGRERIKQMRALAAKVIWDAMDGALGKARGIMNWMRSIADAHTDKGMAIQWETPAGFVAHQENRELGPEKRIKVTRPDGPDQKFTLRIGEGGLDKAKQRAAIAPNIVHSYDAAHLMLTVNAAKAKGLSSFGLVHDSLATHAAHLQTLQDTLRETFVEIYGEPVLEHLDSWFQGCVTFENGVRFPELDKRLPSKYIEPSPTLIAQLKAISEADAELDEALMEAGYYDDWELEDEGSVLGKHCPQVGEWCSESVRESDYFFS